jgi:hypothetical protein
MVRGILKRRRSRSTRRVQFKNRPRIYERRSKKRSIAKIFSKFSTNRITNPYIKNIADLAIYVGLPLTIIAALIQMARNSSPEKLRMIVENAVEKALENPEAAAEAVVRSVSGTTLESESSESSSSSSSSSSSEPSRRRTGSQPSSLWVSPSSSSSSSSSGLIYG